MNLHRAETEAERKEAFRRRSERYLQLGHDRFAAATLVAQSAGPLIGPALDVGTGKGLLAMALARLNMEVVSVDVDDDEQALAALLAEEAGVRGRIQFVRADAVRLPFSGKVFGCAAMMAVLHHLVDPIPVLDEMARVVRPGGVIIMAEFSEAGFELVARVHRETGHEHPRSSATLDMALALIEHGGFRCVERTERQHYRVAVLRK